MKKHLRTNRGIGIDLVDVSRFNRFNNLKHNFIKKVFFSGEVAYCSKYKNRAPHFAGIFAAKESVSKALGTNKFPFISIEIKHNKNGVPEAWKGKNKLPVRISITHTKTIALAIAVQ